MSNGNGFGHKNGNPPKGGVGGNGRLIHTTSDYGTVTRNVAYESGPPTIGGNGTAPYKFYTESNLHGMVLDEDTGVISGTGTLPGGTVIIPLLVIIKDANGFTGRHEQGWTWIPQPL